MKVKKKKIKVDVFDWKFFDKIAKSEPQFDAAKEVRKQRDWLTNRYD